MSTKLAAEIKDYDGAVAAIDGSLTTPGLDWETVPILDGLRAEVLPAGARPLDDIGRGFLLLTAHPGRIHYTVVAGGEEGPACLPDRAQESAELVGRAQQDLVNRQVPGRKSTIAITSAMFSGLSMATSSPFCT